MSFKKRVTKSIALALVGVTIWKIVKRHILKK